MRVSCGGMSCCMQKIALAYQREGEAWRSETTIKRRSRFDFAQGTRFGDDNERGDAMYISPYATYAWLLSASDLPPSFSIAIAQSSNSSRADLVLIHGKVLTVDAKDSIAQAIAIRDGRILAVGSDTQVLALAGPKTSVIDLHGRTATPGLIDTHSHYSQIGTDDL